MCVGALTGGKSDSLDRIDMGEVPQFLLYLDSSASR
jgi:hypothetical protein